MITAPPRMAPYLFERWLLIMRSSGSIYRKIPQNGLSYPLPVYTKVQDDGTGLGVGREAVVLQRQVERHPGWHLVPKLEREIEPRTSLPGKPGSRRGQ